MEMKSAKNKYVKQYENGASAWAVLKNRRIKSVVNGFHREAGRVMLQDGGIVAMLVTKIC